MQTLTFLSPGRVEWLEAPSPRLGGPTEALIRPLAVAACDLDAAIVGGRTPFPGPFALGHEFAGEVIDVGDDVTGIAVGDRVAVAFQPSCGGCAPCRRGHSAACSTAPGTPMYGIGAAGASDNIADGYRTVAPALAAQPGASVLVAGSGSIALYAGWWARTLGAGSVTLASRDRALLARAERLGIDVLPVTDWPRRFATHTITVDCTGEPAGLAALIRATEAYGWCTSAAIYFGGDIPMPLFDMNMKGIRFDTGRVNGAAALPTVLELIARHGLTPATIGATEVGWQNMREALLDGAFKPIAVRD